jgi:hypothetical protein
VLRDESTQALHLHAQLAVEPVDDIAQADHQCRVEHVLAGQPAMQPTRGFGAQPLAQQLDQADHGVAAGFRTVSQRAEVVLGQQAPDLGMRLRRRDLGFDKRLQPRVLDRFHGRQ